MLYNRSHSATACQIESLETRTLLSDAVITPADYDYLSSMRPVASTNGYGVYGRDQSNGEREANDGARLSINGRVFKKGLGLHSDAELHYKLGGKYRSFISDVGMDDEVGNAGSVVFQVFADGAKLFDSGVMYGDSRSRRINVDVSGMNELVLIVRDAGDGNSFDHADFGGARVVRPTGVTPVVTGPADASLDEARGFLSVNGSFTDTDAGPWIGTIDWGDGRAREYLTLEDDHTFSSGHWFPTTNDDDYTVTIRINNGHAVGISKFKVSVDNLPPANVGLAGETNADGSFSAFAGAPFNAGGTFSDPGAFSGETYLASVNYGDGTAIERPAIDGRFFDVQHTFQKPGTYTVTTTVADSNGATGTGTNTVIVTQPTFTYVSDLLPIGRTGTLVHDRASGGSAMTIAGSKYTKGLGVTADSELFFNLGGRYRTLLSDVGVDDEVDGAGASVAFQVFADGTLVFDSGTMVSGNAPQHLSLDVRGVNELRLVASHGAAASTADHGDWANIRLV